ncbi:MAG: ferredoxin [Candidatus Firestonebacteria bacterium RIFOXYA2_FULL_40_8]|nr:MAG: ferredoxin [Candidatus Firestonebacteria bacterium RIFOXYA2_FULL_40_8]
MQYLSNVSTLKLDAKACTGCGMCVKVCPHEVFAISNKKAVIVSLDACMECGACKKNCAFNALEVRSGVGCAAGIIIGTLRGADASCDCD